MRSERLLPRVRELRPIFPSDRSLPASVLNEDDSDDEDAVAHDDHDDERTGTRYNYSECARHSAQCSRLPSDLHPAWFHVIFIMATAYTAMLLTNWNVVEETAMPDSDDAQPVRIGRSHVAFWMRIVSSWFCLALYAWSLLAPAVLPDRFGD